MSAKMQKNSSSIILTSRIRLARNINGFPFPEWASSEDQVQVKSIVKKAIQKIESSFVYKDLSRAKELTKNLLVEQNILSSHFIKDHVKAKAFAFNTKGISIMINEEDHLRLAIQLQGLKLEEAWPVLDELDTALSEKIEYAFSQGQGFATACPSNVGTGMRVSVMVHLPALCLEGKIGPIISAMNESHITVRGLFGEGSMALGHTFQISNLNTLGISEEETIFYLQKVAKSLEKREKLARKNIFSKQKMILKDKVSRAIGILKYAYFLSYEEALDHLSIIILAQSLGLEKELKRLKNLADLSTQLRDGHLRRQKGTRRSISTESLRADRVRELI